MLIPTCAKGMIPLSRKRMAMKRILTALTLAVVTVTLAVPAVSVATSTEAVAWPKKKKCTDWCTNRHGQKFRLKR
jgi:hypothetical protein